MRLLARRYARSKDWWSACFSCLTALLLFLTLLGTTARAQEDHHQTVQFKSELIGKVLPYDTLLPRGYFKSNKRYPVLYLLHGLFGHHDDWITRTNLAEYAADYDLIIVTPEGNDSWYIDSATVAADKYESYILRCQLSERKIRTVMVADIDPEYRTLTIFPIHVDNGIMWKMEQRRKGKRRIFLLQIARHLR